MSTLSEVKAVLEHLSVKLPNINLEPKISLNAAQLQTLREFTLTKELLQEVDEEELTKIVTIISSVIELHNEATRLIEQGRVSDVLSQQQYYSDFCNKYLTWFQLDCFGEEGTRFQQQVMADPSNDALGLSMHKLLDNHNRASRVHKDIVVIGAGPTGLMAALKLFESGAKVTLIEARQGSNIHTRKQAVVLDPSIMADLRHYLGADFATLFSKGQLYPDGKGHIAIGDLEKAMYKRLNQLAELQPSSLRVVSGHAASKILPPEGDFAKFRVSLEGSDQTFDCDYVYAAEGGRSQFTGKQHLLGDMQKASLETDSTSSTYITMLYDIKEDSYNVNPVQSEGPFKNIKQIRDTIKLTAEQKEIFVNNCTNDFLHTYSHFVKSLENDPQSEDLLSLFNALRAPNFLVPDQAIDLRTFETKGQFYIATQVPIQFHKTMDALSKLSKREDLDSGMRYMASNFQRDLQNQWSKLLSKEKFPFLDDTRVKLDHTASQTFQVTPQGSAIAARVLTKDSKSLMVVAGGDLFRSPHFYSGSGISSAHAGVNAFTQYFTNSTKMPEAMNRQLFLANMQHIAKFVDNKMGEYCKTTKPLPSPTAISIQEVGSEALEIDVLIKQMQTYRENLQQGVSGFAIFRYLFQGLRMLKIDIMGKLIERLSASSTYTDLQQKLSSLEPSEKQVLGQHRYGFWNSSETTGIALINKLQAKLDMAKNSEKIVIETTPEIKLPNQAG